MPSPSSSFLAQQTLKSNHLQSPASTIILLYILQKIKLRQAAMASKYTINARSAVAAVAASDNSFRIYFQDTQNGIREGVYKDGKWNVSGKAIFNARRLSPLSAVSWDGGSQVR